MMKFYFTFGQAHKAGYSPVHNWLALYIGASLPLCNYWVEVTAPSYEEARLVMASLFGKFWSSQYSEEEFDSRYYPGGVVLSLLLDKEENRVHLQSGPLHSSFPFYITNGFAYNSET